MALLTPAELLEQIETAITAILSGSQSYTIADRQWTRADIKELRAWRTDLLGEIQAATGTRRTVAEF